MNSGRHICILLTEETMKGWPFFLLGIGLVFSLLSPLSAQRETQQEILVVYYYGSTNIGFCTTPENIEKIKRIKENLPLVYSDLEMKFVLVCLDEDVQEGLKFVRKHGIWDEISIGDAYRNEMALSTLNRAEVPSVPHLFVFKYTLGMNKWNIPLLRKKQQLVELSGEKQIGDWINEDYPLSTKRSSRKNKKEQIPKV